jgi:hypothetical protein
VPISLSYSALTLAGERFDQRVLTAELQRVGGELPGPGALTTLSLLHLQGCWEAFCATGRALPVPISDRLYSRINFSGQSSVIAVPTAQRVVSPVWSQRCCTGWTPWTRSRPCGATLPTASCTRCTAARCVRTNDNSRVPLVVLPAHRTGCGHESMRDCTMQRCMRDVRCNDA